MQISRPCHEEIAKQNWVLKTKHKNIADRKRTGSYSSITVGEKVFVSWPTLKKGQTNYDPTEFAVVRNKHGTMAVKLPKNSSGSSSLCRSSPRKSSQPVVNDIKVVVNYEDLRGMEWGNLASSCCYHASAYRKTDSEAAGVVGVKRMKRSSCAILGSSPSWVPTISRRLFSSHKILSPRNSGLWAGCFFRWTDPGWMNPANISLGRTSNRPRQGLLCRR